MRTCICSTSSSSRHAQLIGLWNACMSFPQPKSVAETNPGGRLRQRWWRLGAYLKSDVEFRVSLQEVEMMLTIRCRCGTLSSDASISWQMLVCVPALPVPVPAPHTCVSRPLRVARLVPDPEAIKTMMMMARGYVLSLPNSATEMGKCTW